MTKIIRVTSCDDCPHATIYFEATPNMVTLSCSKAVRTEQIIGYGIPDWCPLEAASSKPAEKGEFFIPSFLKPWAE